MLKHFPSPRRRDPTLQFSRFGNWPPAYAGEGKNFGQFNMFNCRINIYSVIPAQAHQRQLQSWRSKMLLSS